MRAGASAARAWLHRIPPALAPAAFARVRAALFLLALLPLGRLLLLAMTDRLGAHPVEFVIRSLGTWTLVLLCATLAVTPLRWLTGWAWLIRLRRMLGLFCFFYAALHLLAFAGLDLWFDLRALGREIVRRPYITAGFCAFLLMLPLAATSSNAMIRRLGGRTWQRLHRLVYAVAALGLLHFFWQKAAKNDYAEPAVYAAIIGVLLGVRLLRWAGERRPFGAGRWP